MRKLGGARAHPDAMILKQYNICERRGKNSAQYYWPSIHPPLQGVQDSI
jgi:hypothetical protein